MARHKTHYRDPRFDDGRPPACNQKHLKLLPLAVVGNWDHVTCAKCLTHKPKPVVVASPLARAYSWLRGIFIGGRRAH